MLVPPSHLNKKATTQVLNSEKVTCSGRSNKVRNRENEENLPPNVSHANNKKRAVTAVANVEPKEELLSLLTTSENLSAEKVNTSSNEIVRLASHEQLQIPQLTLITVPTIPQTPYTLDTHEEALRDSWVQMRRAECNYQAHPDYMKHQREITCEMRKILVDWLLDMTEYVNLPMDTLFVAINIIDRFSSKRTVKKQYYQLLGVVGLWIAIKMHEFCDKELIKELLVMTDNSFTLDEAKVVEMEVLTALDFRLCSPTSLWFLNYSLQLMNYLCETSVLDNRLLKYLPSEIAAAAIYLTLFETGEMDHMTSSQTFEAFTGYTINNESFVKCACELLESFKACRSVNQYIRNRFATKEFHNVASTPAPNSPFVPSYPAGLVEVLNRETNLNSSSVVGDIGSGTGIFSQHLLSTGCTVYGVEPNKQMRIIAEETLTNTPIGKFISVDGTAEKTTLMDNSIDIVTAAQAFHWFEFDKAKKEFFRILKKESNASTTKGFVALIWNDRNDSTPFAKEYTKILQDYCPEYEKVNHRNVVSDATFEQFFSGNFRTWVGSIAQQFDFEGLVGRFLSSSYAPAPDHPNCEPAKKALQQLFDKYNQNGVVEMVYNTTMHYGNLTPE